jgi:hypothetical protein
VKYGKDFVPVTEGSRWYSGAAKFSQNKSIASKIEALTLFQIQQAKKLSAVTVILHFII